MLDRPNVDSVDPVKVMINVGAGFDVPTAIWVKGKYDEVIMNGGLGTAVGVVGIGNSFKSTILKYLQLSALNKMSWDEELGPSFYWTYDTECNMHIDVNRQLTKKFEYLKNKDVFLDKIWLINDKVTHSGNAWYELYRDFLNSKIKNIKKNQVEMPFLTLDGKSLIKVTFPTFSCIDSLSGFETDDAAKIQAENELGESGGNTIHMRQGLAKTRLLMDIPGLCGRSQNFFGMTGHIGKEKMLASGPGAPMPTKKLQYLKNGDKINGIPDQFNFYTNVCWHSINTTPFLCSDKTKGVEYPKTPQHQIEGDNDLFLVKLVCLRNKSGPTGFIHEVLVSQREGVLPTLTEFHNIKETNRYGIGGNNLHYYLDIYPELSLQRTTVRQKIDNDPLLARAINITSEMCQIKYFHPNIELMFPNLLCTPKELYDDLKSKGFNWNVLLNTRGWYTFNNDKHPIPYLSTIDLMRMRLGFVPHWLK